MNTALHHIRTRLEDILADLKTAERKAKKTIAGVHPKQRKSATNLIHYLAFRRGDQRSLQDELHNEGLSSLASSESHIMRQVQAVLQRLNVSFTRKNISEIDYSEGTRILRGRAASLFGQKENAQIPFLMVTFDDFLADNYGDVKSLIKAGMNVARINCAHDNPVVWKKMIANVHKAARATGQPCKVYLDLAGPKIRTVLLAKGNKKGRLKMREDELFFLAEQDAVFDKKDKVVGCTLPGVVKDLQAGDRVLFDDGLFEAIVEMPGELIAALRMNRISAIKSQIKAEKGINFPDTTLSVRSLTDFDKSVLPFAQEYADLFGFSFVRTASDVAELQQLMRHGGGKKIPIILKIETFEAVQNLPDLLLQGMAEPVFGVMIARGDLAVEIGFERMSEIQEEILWLCEAAHVPVIWATQVLETMNKSGIATRSELTDAARAAQAECVMLNKGKYLLTVLATLQDILFRTGGHHVKKRYMFRPLKIAERYLERIDLV